MPLRSLVLAAFLVAVVQVTNVGVAQPTSLPYADAGLTEQEAAAHLLSRLTYGARPGDIDRVVAMGLDAWFAQQLAADSDDAVLQERLAAGFPAWTMDPLDMASTYVGLGSLRLMMIRDSVVTREAWEGMSRREQRQQIETYMAERGLRDQREILPQLIGQRLAHSVYSDNQLQAVLVDFWYNHFNVSHQKAGTRPHLLSYERDAIRPHVLGPFRALLGATARHPAMLIYLDNAQSRAPDSVRTARDYALVADLPEHRRERAVQDIVERRKQRTAMVRERQMAEGRPPPRQAGLNENYARELLELHTLGVDGGYTQSDVVAVARAFSGWQVYNPLANTPANQPAMSASPRNRRHQQRRERQQAGQVQDGTFLFRAASHDAEAKTLLGITLPAGGGLDDGERVLDLLARHPSTAQHLSRKLAVRFVSDNPPPALVDRLAQVYLGTEGDLRAVMQALVYAPEFWAPEALQAKVKSPFELMVSTVRALDARLHADRSLVEWLQRMGQPLFAYPAPTGHPDEAAAWINTGTLVNRMNFAMQVAAGQLAGIEVDLLALNNGHEPPTVQEALSVYVPLLLPGHDAEALIAQLLPLATDPNLPQKLATADTTASPGTEPADSDTLARIVGVILGSPAFQRR